MHSPGKPLFLPKGHDWLVSVRKEVLWSTIKIPVSLQSYIFSYFLILHFCLFFSFTYIFKLVFAVDLLFTKSIACIRWRFITCLFLSLSFSFFFLSFFFPKLFLVSFHFFPSPSPGFLLREGVKRKKLNPSIEKEVDQSGAFFLILLKNPLWFSFFSLWILKVACPEHLLTHMWFFFFFQLIFPTIVCFWWMAKFCMLFLLLRL